MVAGLNLSWQGIKRKAVYTEGAGPVCKCTGQCTLPFFNPCQVHKLPPHGEIYALDPKFISFYFLRHSTDSYTIIILLCGSTAVYFMANPLF